EVLDRYGCRLDTSALERLQLLQRHRRRRSRTAEQMALQSIHPELDELATFALSFDSLGNDATTHSATHVQHGAHELELGRIGVDAAYEVAIDLHVVGTQL